jgi:two-component system, cell cycle response regulator DivK
MASPRLLIVDDNALNVTIARVVLAADQFVVESASNAAEALQKLPSFQPAVILMDVQMPGMNGLELTQLLKSDPATRHICIVAFTAFAMRGDEAKMRAVGCDGYLSKPINVNTFAAEVRGCLAASAKGTHTSLLPDN